MGSRCQGSAHRAGGPRTVASAGSQQPERQRRVRAARALRGAPSRERHPLEDDYIESGAPTPASASVRAKAFFAARQSANRASLRSLSSAKNLTLRVELVEVRRDVARVARQTMWREVLDDALHDLGKLGQPSYQREFRWMRQRRECGADAQPARRCANARRKHRCDAGMTVLHVVDRVFVFFFDRQL